MKKSLFAAVAVLALATLVGCAQVGTVTSKLDYSTGTMVTDQQMQSFVKGKTRKDDVATSIGYPAQRSQIGGNEVWTYPYTMIPAMPFKPNVSTSTVFEFNSKGVLVNAYKAGGTPGQSGNPLLDAAGM